MSETEIVKAEVVTPAAVKKAPEPLTAKTNTAVTDEHVRFSLIRYPKYEYKTGTTMFLSKRQQIVVDAYLKTGNEKETTRILNGIIGRHGGGHFYTTRAIRGWLQKPHVAQYVASEWVKKGKANWLDEDGWKAWGADVLNGLVKATTVMGSVWKEYGKSQGWYKDTGSQGTSYTQINFVQSDGRA